MTTKRNGKLAVRRVSGGGVRIGAQVFGRGSEVPLALLARVCGRTTQAFAKRARAERWLAEDPRQVMQAGRLVWVVSAAMAEATLLHYGRLSRKRK